MDETVSEGKGKRVRSGILADHKEAGRALVSCVGRAVEGGCLKRINGFQMFWSRQQQQHYTPLSPPSRGGAHCWAGDELDFAVPMCASLGSLELLLWRGVNAQWNCEEENPNAERKEKIKKKTAAQHELQASLS